MPARQTAGKRESRRQVRGLPGGTPGWQVSGLPRLEWIGVSPDDMSEDPRPIRRGSSARNCVPESRDREAVGFSQLNLCEKQLLFLIQVRVSDCYCQVSFRSSALPHSTKGYPSWQLRIEDENQEKFSLRIHRIFKVCVPVGDFHSGPVEIKCNAAGKRVRLQYEWCGRPRTHRKSELHPMPSSASASLARMHRMRSLSMRDLTHPRLERIFQVDRIGANCFNPVLLDAVLAQAARRQD